MALVIPRFSLVARTLRRADTLRHALTQLISQEYESVREEHDSSGGSLLDRLMSHRDGIAQGAQKQARPDRQAADVVAGGGEDGGGGVGRMIAAYSMLGFETTDGGLDGGAAA